MLPAALIHTILLHLTGGETEARSGLVICSGYPAEKPAIKLGLGNLALLVSGTPPKVSKACPALMLFFRAVSVFPLVPQKREFMVSLSWILETAYSVWQRGFGLPLRNLSEEGTRKQWHPYTIQW